MNNAACENYKIDGVSIQDAFTAADRALIVAVMSDTARINIYLNFMKRSILKQIRVVKNIGRKKEE